MSRAGAAPGTTGWKQLSVDVVSPKDAAAACIRLETNDAAGVVGKAPSPLSLKTAKPFRVWFDGIEFTARGG